MLLVVTEIANDVHVEAANIFLCDLLGFLSSVVEFSIPVGSGDTSHPTGTEAWSISFSSTIVSIKPAEEIFRVIGV